MQLSRVESINDFLQKDEQSLLYDTASGSTLAYTVLYRRYLQRMLNYVMVFSKQDRVAADDIVQEVFISIWETRENLITVKSFEAYLKRCIKNRLLNRIKHEEFLKRLHEKIENEFSGTYTEEAVDFKEYFNIAEEAVRELPPKRQLVFMLSTTEGLSLDQIAQILSISRSRVKQQLYQAVAHVKQRIKKQ